MFDWLKQKKSPDSTPSMVQKEIAKAETVAAPAEPVGDRHYAIQPGTMFPLHGFMFRITEVTEDGLVAVVCGVTKKLKKMIDESEIKKSELDRIARARSAKLEKKLANNPQKVGVPC
jgi:hypothetical protein